MPSVFKMECIVYLVFHASKWSWKNIESDNQINVLVFPTSCEEWWRVSGLIYLQVTEWACHSAVDSARRLRLPKQRPRSLSPKAQSAAHTPRSCCFHLPLMSHEDKVEWHMWMWRTQWFASEVRNPGLKHPSSFIMGLKQSYPIFTL